MTDREKKQREILESLVETQFCYGHKERTGTWVTNNICNDCGLPVIEKKKDYIDQALSELAKLNAIPTSKEMPKKKDVSIDINSPIGAREEAFNEGYNQAIDDFYKEGL